MKETLLDYIITVTETTMREKIASNRTQFTNKRGFANAEILEAFTELVETD
jgi:hypothetical protein